MDRKKTVTQTLRQIAKTGGKQASGGYDEQLALCLELYNREELAQLVSALYPKNPNPVGTTEYYSYNTGKNYWVKKIRKGEE